MDIQAAFEDWLANGGSDEGWKFGQKYKDDEWDSQARCFYDGVTAGQKTLSPEVRQVLEEFVDIILMEDGSWDVSSTIAKAKKLLEEKAGE